MIAVFYQKFSARPRLQHFYQTNPVNRITNLLGIIMRLQKNTGKVKEIHDDNGKAQFSFLAL